MAPRPVFTTALAVIAILLVVPSAHAAWPQGMQQVFWNPTVVHLPDQNRAYVLGGRFSSLPIPPFLLSDVAVIQLDQSITLTDANTPAVNPAPFSLPSPNFMMTAVVDQQFAPSSVYNLGLLSAPMTGSPPPPLQAYVARNFLAPSASSNTVVQALNAPVKVPSPWSSLANPCWSSTAKPIQSGSTGSLPSDPAAYLFGNWTTVNDELLRFKIDGTLETVTPTSLIHPSPRGWGSLMRWNQSTLLLAGGNPGSNDLPKLGDIWLYDLVGNGWTKYPYAMPDPRDDFQTVQVPSPDSTSSRKYAVFIGNSASSLINYVDLESNAIPTAATVAASPSGKFTLTSRTAAMAAFYHDRHIFLVGGLNSGMPGPGNGGVSFAAIKVSAGSSGLSFQWVDTFIPSKGNSGGDGTTGGTDSSLSTGAWIGIMLGATAVLGLATAGIVWKLRNRHTDTGGSGGGAGGGMAPVKVPTQDLDSPAQLRSISPTSAPAPVPTSGPGGLTITTAGIQRHPTMTGYLPAARTPTIDIGSPSSSTMAGSPAAGVPKYSNAVDATKKDKRLSQLGGPMPDLTQGSAMAAAAIAAGQQHQLQQHQLLQQHQQMQYQQQQQQQYQQQQYQQPLPPMMMVGGGLYPSPSAYPATMMMLPTGATAAPAAGYITAPLAAMPPTGPAAVAPPTVADYKTTLESYGSGGAGSGLQRPITPIAPPAVSMFPGDMYRRPQSTQAGYVGGAGALPPPEWMSRPRVASPDDAAGGRRVMSGATIQEGDDVDANGNAVLLLP